MDRFCPRCGGGLGRKEVDGSPRPVCGECGRVHYRNSKPCVGAVILREDQVLLSKRATNPHRGQWDLPGGFLEWSEAPEAGLAREVREETGLTARNLRLIGAWAGAYGEDATLNLVYACEVEGEPVADSDSLELHWFPVDALPELAFPHEREALARARRGLREGRVP